jgi:hypothetical protein
LSIDARDLSELLSLTLEGARTLQGSGEGCFFKASLKSVVIPGSVRKIGKLSFGFCTNLDLDDFGSESQFQRIGRPAFRCYSLKLIGIPRSVEILERFAFSKHGTKVVTFESGSALGRIEELCFYESSLKNIWIPGHVDFIGESAVAVDPLELIEVCDANAQFMISEHILIDERDAITVRYFGGWERISVSKRVRIIGHMCFDKRKFG